MFQIIKLSENDNVAVSPMDIPENVLIEVHNIKTQTKITQKLRFYSYSQSNKLTTKLTLSLL